MGQCLGRVAGHVVKVEEKRLVKDGEEVSMQVAGPVLKVEEESLVKDGEEVYIRVGGPVLKVEEECLVKDGEEVSTPLPEDLVERILAMVPYPHIFKARALSKSWLMRFSPISAVNADEEMKQLAISFHKRVSEYCDKWRTFSPVFVGKEDLVAYDRESQHWHKTPTLSFLPLDHPMRYPSSHVYIEGALVLIKTNTRHDRYAHDLYVANIFTRSWKQLPPHPQDKGWLSHGEKMVCYMGTYKVVCLYDYMSYFLVQTYDSQLGAWSNKRFNKSQDSRVFRMWAAYFNGVVYWVVSLKDHMARGLLAFNVTEETFQVLQMPPIDVPIDPDLVDLVVCKAGLLLVVYNGKLGFVPHVIVLKIDVELQIWVEMKIGPPSRCMLGQPPSDGDWIFFRGVRQDKILAYNFERDEWSDFFLPYSIIRGVDQYKYQREPYSFRAGLNPFVAL